MHLLNFINLGGMILFIYYENVLRFEIFKPILIYSTNIFKQFIFETYVCAMTFYLKDEYGNIASCMKSLLFVKIRHENGAVK